jgi:hypothetical protein
MLPLNSRLAFRLVYGMATSDSNLAFISRSSRAIMAYLCDTYGGSNNPLYPRDPKKRALVDMALYFDIERLAPNIHAYAVSS